MAQKVIEIVGASKESFAKAAENAVAEAAKAVRGMKWSRVAEFEMQLDECANLGELDRVPRFGILGLRGPEALKASIAEKIDSFPRVAARH